MAGLPLACARHVQLVQDVCSDSGCGSSSQGHYRHTMKLASEFTELFVVRTKVMAPLADAVRFIYHKPGDMSCDGHMTYNSHSHYKHAGPTLQHFYQDTTIRTPLHTYLANI